jgi:transcription initiation factor IIE alpha subunit
MSLGLGDVPLTSIRRAITRLSYQGRIVKTDRQREGLYGKPEYIWEIDTRQQKIF